MKFPTLAIALAILISGVHAGGKKPQPSVWEVHRSSMETWLRWPKNDTRGLHLSTLPACIQRCITPERAILDIYGEKADARTINRRIFCDPRLNLLNIFFLHTLGPCSLESCRHEHGLNDLQTHFKKWMTALCAAPVMKKPSITWGLRDKHTYPPPKEMIDPAAADVDGLVGEDAEEKLGGDVDALMDEDTQDLESVDDSPAARADAPADAPAKPAVTAAKFTV
ncbi:hypothetical protein CH063_15982 [Colletotrichum higginsianum]|uniref:Uncharacterized protein n=1 Tax=Colletotrichum higginsianum (strain IMI 349063) TaxID=759273 RepID=H1W5D0_COLHI|nr:hypothetical protein CH63R_09307 [Colletotrichum higginsianum IMI 349063]OBR07786.1 hypothetical protein CH63R_09307 [Colletotrichum higginsianum IMI 349063]CCF47694.1 hypothetical protein CH063_15982 [Colletotrichum higginsianum]